MNNIKLLLINILCAICFSQVSIAQTLNIGTFFDSRDHNEYKTVNYRGKTMFAENLRYVSSNSKSAKNNSDNDKEYGRYYTYDEASNVCPEGWELVDLSDKQTQNLVVKYWNYLVKQELFFKILTGRYIKSNSNDYYFMVDSYTGHWWVQSRDLSLNNDNALSIYFILNSMQLAEFPKNNRGFSVRCVKE